MNFLIQNSIISNGIYLYENINGSVRGRKVRVIFISKNKIAKASKTKKLPMLWQEKDGMHHISPASVFHHSKHEHENLVILFEDYIEPFGVRQSKDSLSKFFAMITLIIRSRKSLSKSTILARFIEAGSKYIVIIIIGVVLLYGLVAPR